MINKLLSENIIESDFYKYDLEIGLPRLLEKIMNVFKTVDKNMTYTWDESNKKKWKGSGWFGFAIKGTLIFNGIPHTYSLYWCDNYQHTTSKFEIDNTIVMEVKKEVIVWDAGCSTSSQHISITNDDILSNLLNCVKR